MSNKITTYDCDRAFDPCEIEYVGVMLPNLEDKGDWMTVGQHENIVYMLQLEINRWKNYAKECEEMLTR